MRKSLILLACLLALSAAVFAVVPAAVQREKDAVVLQEERVFGDPAAAAGLTVDTSASASGRLHWDLHTVLGETPQTAVAFHYTPEDTWQYGEAERYLYVQTDVQNFSASGGVQSEDAGPLARQVQAVMDAAEPGTESSETISLETLPYLPLRCDGNLDGAWAGGFEGLWPGVSDFFRVPVPEGAAVTVDVSKDLDGHVYSLGMGPNEAAGGWLQCGSVYDAQAGGFYLTVTSYAGDGTFLPLLSVPAGYGVYFLPVEVAFNVQLGGDAFQVDAANVRLVFPLDPAVEVLELLGDGDCLLLRTRERERDWITVIDRTAMAEAQKFPLFEKGTGGAQALFAWEGNLAALDGDGNLTLLGRETGRYVRQWEHNIAAAALENFSLTPYRDGQRLLLAAPGYYQNNFRIALCDETGLRYAARFHSSLDWFADGALRIQPDGALTLGKERD